MLLLKRFIKFITNHRFLFFSFLSLSLSLFLSIFWFLYFLTLFFRVCLSFQRINSTSEIDAITVGLLRLDRIYWIADGVRIYDSIPRSAPFGLDDSIGIGGIRVEPAQLIRIELRHLFWPESQLERWNSINTGFFFYSFFIWINWNGNGRAIWYLIDNCFRSNRVGHSPTRSEFAMAGNGKWWLHDSVFWLWSGLDRKIET